MQKNCSFFDLERPIDGFEQKFKDIEVEGRSIRVNKDDEGNGRNKQFSKKSSYNSKRRSKRPFQRSRTRRR